MRQNWQSFSFISIVQLCQGVNGELDVLALFKKKKKNIFPPA